MQINLTQKISNKNKSKIVWLFHYKGYGEGETMADAVLSSGLVKNKKDALAFVKKNFLKNNN